MIVGVGVGRLGMTVGVGVGGLEQTTAVLKLESYVGAKSVALGFMSPATECTGTERLSLASNELAELPLFSAGELPLF